MQHKELTEKIIGCAYKVYNKLGYGFLESVYDKVLLREFKRTGLKSENQKPIKVYNVKLKVRTLGKQQSSSSC